MATRRLNLPDVEASRMSGALVTSDLAQERSAEVRWPGITVRQATVDDLPHLLERLRDQADYFEQQDLRRCIIFVAEYDGKIVGFSAARLNWQIEPILLTPEFKKHAPHFARQKATYLLIRELDRWIGDRTKNRSGIYYYFCHIRDRTMQKLALSFGMIRVYYGKFYGRDLWPWAVEGKQTKDKRRNHWRAGGIRSGWRFRSKMLRTRNGWRTRSSALLAPAASLVHREHSPGFSIPTHNCGQQFDLTVIVDIDPLRFSSEDARQLERTISRQMEDLVFEKAMTERKQPVAHERKE